MGQFQHDYENIQRNDIEINQIDIELPPKPKHSQEVPGSNSKLIKEPEPRLNKQTKDIQIPVSDVKSGDLNDNCEVMKKVYNEF